MTGLFATLAFFKATSKEDSHTICFGVGFLRACLGVSALSAGCVGTADSPADRPVAGLLVAGPLAQLTRLAAATETAKALMIKREKDHARILNL